MSIETRSDISFLAIMTVLGALIGLVAAISTW